MRIVVSPGGVSVNALRCDSLPLEPVVWLLCPDGAVGDVIWQVTLVGGVSWRIVSLVVHAVHPAPLTWGNRYCATRTVDLAPVYQVVVLLAACVYAVDPAPRAETAALGAGR